MRAEIEELSAAFEISKRRWMVTHKPSIAEDAESVPRETEEAKPDGAKIERMVPAKSAIAKHLRGGRRRNDEYYATRRQVLASYQFVTDEEESRVPPRRDPLIPSTARTKVSDLAKPAGSKIDRTVLAKSAVETHLRGGRRRSDEYYVMRRQVLASYQFVADKECQGEKPTGEESRFPPGRDPPILTGAPIAQRKGMAVKVRRLVGILPSTGQRQVLWLSTVVVSDAEDGYVQVMYDVDDRFRDIRLAMDDVKHIAEN